MPEPVFYMRGYPPFRDHTVSEDMAEDLKAVTTVSEDLLDQVASTLSVAEGFLDTPTLNSYLREILPEASPVASIRRVVLNVKSEDVPDLLKRLRQFLQEDPEGFSLTADHIDQLASLLPRLLKPIPALRRFRKAERLAKITGQPLEEVQLICDLRPVFDELRESIEGLVPFTRIKIVATGGDGLPNIFEAELSAKQVADLAEQAEKAVRKLTVLREKGDQWADYGVPNVPLTRSKEKGSSND